MLDFANTIHIKQSVKVCDNCQRFANIIHQPLEQLTPTTSPLPQWGLYWATSNKQETDDGRQLENTNFKEFCYKLDIKHLS